MLHMCRHGPTASALVNQVTFGLLLTVAISAHPRSDPQTCSGRQQARFGTTLRALPAAFVERRHGRPQLELDSVLGVIVAPSPASQDFQPAANSLRLLGGAKGPAHHLGTLLEAQLVRVPLARVTEPRSMLADNTLGAALNLGLTDRFAPRGLDDTRALLDLEAVGSAQGPHFCTAWS